MRMRIATLVLLVVLMSGCAPQRPPTATAAPSAAPTTAATATVVLTTTAAPPAVPTAAATATVPPPNLTAAPTPPAAVAVATYTSSALGLSFRYLLEQFDMRIGVLEQGDRIYVHMANTPPTAGQWVQVFSKRADESLPDAITRLIMPGYPAEDCQVRPLDVPPVGHAAEGITYAGIAVRSVPGEEPAAHLARWEACPQPYTVVGGIGYFQGDTRHPERLLFFSIGQYGIAADDGLLWQETVRLQ